jgi:hypothetical protein
MDAEDKQRIDKAIRLNNYWKIEPNLTSDVMEFDLATARIM